MVMQLLEKSEGGDEIRMAELTTALGEERSAAGTMSSLTSAQASRMMPPAALRCASMLFAAIAR